MQRDDRPPRRALKAVERVMPHWTVELLERLRLWCLDLPPLPPAVPGRRRSTGVATVDSRCRSTDPGGIWDRRTAPTGFSAGHGLDPAAHPKGLSPRRRGGAHPSRRTGEETTSGEARGARLQTDARSGELPLTG